MECSRSRKQGGLEESKETGGTEEEVGERSGLRSYRAWQEPGMDPTALRAWSVMFSGTKRWGDAWT